MIQGICQPGHRCLAGFGTIKFPFKFPFAIGCGGAFSGLVLLTCRILSLWAPVLCSNSPHLRKGGMLLIGEGATRQRIY